MKLGIIGCGNMGTALINGVIAAEKVDSRDVLAGDRDRAKLARLKRLHGIATTGDNRRVAEAADVIILAVKPQQFAVVTAEIAPLITAKKTIISIAAGVRLAALRKQLTGTQRIIRVMPNMPACIGQGITAVSYLKKGLPGQKKIAHMIFSSVGAVLEIDEKHFDAVTALSGSGPAYFFYIIQALIDGGVKLGLDAATARVLAEVTAWGSLALLAEGKETPLERIAQVASKGGTTEAALKVFKEKKLALSIAGALQAAKKRSQQLSRR